jgi:hypothetical protein
LIIFILSYRVANFLYANPQNTTALHYRYDIQMYCTFVLFVNQHFPGLSASGTHCTPVTSHLPTALPSEECSFLIIWNRNQGDRSDEELGDSPYYLSVLRVYASYPRHDTFRRVLCGTENSIYAIGTAFQQHVS